MIVTFCPTNGDPCRKGCDKFCHLSRKPTGKIPYTAPVTNNTNLPHRFTPEEIEGFLTFLLEGGADKRCSNVYLIITQLRDDLRRLEMFKNALRGNAGWAYDLATKSYRMTSEEFDQELNRNLPNHLKRISKDDNSSTS